MLLIIRETNVLEQRIKENKWKIERVNKTYKDIFGIIYCISVCKHYRYLFLYKVYSYW